MRFDRIADKKRVDFITNEIIKSVSPGSLILDIGCGNGIISKAIAEAGFQVIAIDSSDKTIETAQRENSHPNIQYKIVRAGELRAEPSKYSAIICSEVLEHLHEPASLLQIIHKSLKDDGILVVTVPNGLGPREVFVTRPVQYLQKRNNFLSRGLSAVKRRLGYTGTTVQSSADDLTHIQFFTVGSFHKLARQTGFYIEVIRESNFVEQVFPYSLLTKKILALQRLDCAIAERLPLQFTSGFMSVWKKV